MLESTIQRKIIEHLKREGWLAVKLIQTNMNGIMDVMALRGGRVFFLEVKRPGKKLEPLQEYRARQLTEAGFEVYWTDSYEDYTQLYNNKIKC